MINSKVKYTTDFRINALDLAERVGMQQAARQLNIHLNTILTWKKKLNENGLQALANTSRSQQKHPGRKLTNEKRQAIIDMKVALPHCTYQQIKDFLKLDCDISVISRLLSFKDIQSDQYHERLVLTYKVNKNMKKNIYTFILYTPAGLFKAEHDEIDIDFVTDCCLYWLDQLHKHNVLQPGFELDVSSLYLILREKTRESFSLSINTKYSTRIITGKSCSNKQEEAGINYELNLTASQFLFNYIQHRKFLPIPAPSYGNIPSKNDCNKLCLVAAEELQNLGLQLFFKESLGQALNIFDLVIRCCEFIGQFPTYIYRHSMLLKAKIISYNKSFDQAESIYKQLIAKLPDDNFAGWCWYELSELYYYSGKKELVRGTIEQAEKIFDQLYNAENNDPVKLDIYCKIAMLRRNDNEVLRFCDKLLLLPDLPQYIDYKCNALFLKGCTYYNQHDFKTGIDFFNQLLKKHMWSVSHKIKAMIYFNIAQQAYFDNNPVECEKNLKLAIAKAEQIGYQLLLARCREIEGSCFMQNQKIVRAISSYLHCLEIFQKFNCINDICRICYQLGQAYQLLHQPILQLRWAKEMLKYSLPNSVNDFTAYAYDLICSYYYDQANYRDLAKYALRLASIATKVQYPFFSVAAETYTGISDLELKRKRAVTTAKIAFKSLESYVGVEYSALYLSLKEMLAKHYDSQTE